MVYKAQSREEGAEVYLDVGYCHLPEIVPEVIVLEVREDCHDLIGGAKGGDEGADSRAVAEFEEKFEFVEDTCWGGCYVYFLNGDVAGLRLSADAGT